MEVNKGCVRMEVNRGCVRMEVNRGCVWCECGTHLTCFFVVVLTGICVPGGSVSGCSETIGE